MAQSSCLICEKPIADYEPVYCCNGMDCGCKGAPINPPVCSVECEAALYGYIGYSYDMRITRWTSEAVTGNVEARCPHGQ